MRLIFGRVEQDRRPAANTPSRHRPGRRATGAAVLIVGCGIGLAACANATVHTTTQGNTSGVYRDRIVVGGVASLTGPLPADFAPAMQGAAAYFDMVNAEGGVNGRKIDFAYRLDDESDPASDVSAARTLVDEDHVFAVVPVATPSFAGGVFLSSHDVPTFGYDVDPNPDWAGKSMFGTTGSYQDFTGIAQQAAFLAEQHRVKNAAVIAYSIEQSKQGCEGDIAALRYYGTHIAFEDLSVPAPAFDLHADVTRMKLDHVDMVISCLDLNGNILLARTMAQDEMSGVTQLWFDGYDQVDLDEFTRLMQGVYFYLSNVPFEVAKLYPGRYPGMDEFVEMLKRYEPHVTSGTAALSGWQSADLFVAGLRAIGRDVTRTRLIAALNRLTDYTANGIDSPIDWKTAHGPIGSPDNCGVFVQVQGTRFVPVYGAPPSVFSCFPSPHALRAPVPLLRPVPKGVPPLGPSA